MFSIIYHFKVKEGCEEGFLDNWKELTHYFLEHCRSMGSRLHQSSENEYIAYAQWPTRQIWLVAGEQLPESARELQAKMRASCDTIQITYEMEVVSDLLKN